MDVNPEVVAEIDTAPAPEATAAPELPAAQEAAPESPEDKPASKTFTQEELDAIVAKRLAREQRKWQREQALQPPAPPVPKELPPADQFESVEAYAQALATKKAEELIYQRDVQKQQAEVLEAYREREEEARDKYEDFEQVAYNPSLKITDVMAETIRASDIGPDVAYYLGTNPKEAERISRLSPFLQAKEIGKIEVKVASEPPVRKTTSAPAPLRPVSARASTTGVIDTTDPRSIKSLSTSEWIEAERQRQIRKLQAQAR